ncbi:xanthine dehydrogenase accessory factor [Actinoplanes tereljensis]|uniref:Xanthine dehydrogenase n=1 Tax=Paractinoplanes tereljensis TaxID=571912 RepID=A0A919NGU0_9ACTN|nr:XdhC/CoxI family protein [Actinoplanes tereljensis]GIF17895.1 xanthine dehydrogenase [Actinoplanes tereljensis]
MRDVLPALLPWWHAGAAAGLATVTATWSSAPRAAGAMMAVGPDGSVVGSVSGGCVEAAVHDLCVSVAASGVPRTARFGVSDDEAFGVGLTCGGTISVLVERVCPVSFPELPVLASAVLAGRPATLVTRLDDARHLLLTDDGPVGTLGDPSLDAAVANISGLQRIGKVNASASDIPSLQRIGEVGAISGLRRIGGVEMFAAAFRPAARMIVFGATDHAAATARIGAFLGYHVTVCDARPVFATAARFPGADAVVVDWPHRYLAREAAAGRIDGRTVLCVLTHDPKFDVPVLEVAVRLGVAYIGVMGSRRTHRDRLARLRAAGVAEVDLEGLSSPLGLDLGGRTPEETAVSIAAEIVALRHGGSGLRLSETDGPIHAGVLVGERDTVEAAHRE